MKSAVNRKRRSAWKAYAKPRAPRWYVRLMRPKDLANGKGFRYPIFGPDGNPRKGICRTRYIPPIKIEEKEVKCLLTDGTKNCINFMPLANNRTWPEIIADVSETLFDAESEFKGAAIAALGYNVYTTGSVWGHRTKDGADRKPIDDFASLNLKGRKVFLVPDNDVHINPNVQDAVFDREAHLRSLGADVEILLLPAPVWDHAKRDYIRLGADDYLHAAKDADEAFEALPTYPLTDPRFAKWGKTRSPPKNSALRSLPPLDTTWLTEKPPTLEYTWEALLPRHGVGLLVAEGGVGKTQLAVDLAVAVATGGRMLSLPTRRGRVVYLGLEDPPDVLRRRVYYAARRRRKAMGVSQDRRQFDADIRANLIVVSLVGSQFHLIEQDRGTVKQAATLDDFIVLLKAEDTAPVELTVIDPMSRLHGMDENANAIGTALINAAERIAREALTTVLIAHHTGKGNSKNESAYSARGASGLADAARVVLRLKELSPNELKGITNIQDADSPLKLIHAKCNYAKRYKDVYLRRTAHGGLELFEPEFKNANKYDLWITKLGEWYASNEQKPFTRRQVTQDQRAAVSGISTSRDKARKFFDDARRRGDIVRSATHSKYLLSKRGAK